MTLMRNPGRVAGLWYLLLILVGPVRLLYIPNKLFVPDNAGATVNNIVAHEGLFRWGMVSELVGAIVLVLLVLAFYRLFENVDRQMAAQVVIFGGVMPGVIYVVNAGVDFGALSIAQGGRFLSVFDKPQQDVLAMLMLRLHGHILTASLFLAGVWLFPLAILVYRSRFLPRFLGVWLFAAGCGWIVLCLTGFLAPEYREREFTWFQPVFFAEPALTLWLLIKGAQPPNTSEAGPKSVVAV